MKTLGSPRGLVMHAGLRLWPQLDALAQWGDGLTDVRLILAHGDDEVGGPAERIEAFIAANLPHIKVERFGNVYDDDPAETATAIAAATASDGPWMVDLSGGTRLMFAGGVLAASRLPDISVVYRDPAGPWYQIGDDGAAHQAEGTSTRAIERFTVEGLLNVTWAEDDRRVHIVDSRIESEIWEAARRSLAKDGRRWRADFQRAVTGVKRRGQGDGDPGRLFERYVLALLRQLGIAEDDSATSVKLEDDGASVQEVDVVVNCNGWLYVIDCKLGDGKGYRRGSDAKLDPLGTQIREAFATRRLLGDGGDQFVLLRPDRVISTVFRSLCAEYQITVVDKVVLAKDPLPAVLRRLIRPPGADL